MKIIAFVIALAMVTMLVDGCSSTDNGLTVGQKLDRAFNRASYALIEAGDAFSVDGEGTDATVSAFTSTISDKALLSALAVSDAGINASIVTKLAKAPGLGATRIDIDTRDGVVTLSGSIDSETTRQRAECIARGNRDVVRVDNFLTLKDL
jgi:osmotically-inducible protein OsmY